MDRPSWSDISQQIGRDISASAPTMIRSPPESTGGIIQELGGAFVRNQQLGGGSAGRRVSKSKI
jgi:hypothetical protein